jgi:hypothetical protein
MTYVDSVGYYVTTNMSRDSSVSTADDHVLKDRSRFPAKRGMFLFGTASRPAMGPGG